MIIYDADFARDTVENIRYAYENGFPVKARVINQLFQQTGKLPKGSYSRLRYILICILEW